MRKSPRLPGLNTHRRGVRQQPKEYKGETGLKLQKKSQEGIPLGGDTSGILTSSTVAGGPTENISLVTPKGGRG